MTKNSLGLVETMGLVGAIEAADAGTKSANVVLQDYELTRAGLITVKFTGDVAAVKTAVSSACAAAARVGQVVSVHVIPRPDPQLDRLTGTLPEGTPPLDEPAGPDEEPANSVEESTGGAEQESQPEGDETEEEEETPVDSQENGGPESKPKKGRGKGRAKKK